LLAIAEQSSILNQGFFTAEAKVFKVIENYNIAEQSELPLIFLFNTNLAI